MSSMEMFALGLLVVCALGLGVSVVMEAAKLIIANSRRTQLQSRLESRNATVQTLQRQAEAQDREIMRRQSDLDRLINDRARVEGLIKIFQAEKVELIHEIGVPEGTNALFVCDLKTTSDFSRIDARRLVFSREIWRHRNVAHVWSDGIDTAIAHAQRAFNGRSGVIPGRMLPWSEGTDAPPPGSAEPMPGSLAVPAAANGPVPRRPATDRPAPERSAPTAAA